jgi:zinc protease
LQGQAGLWAGCFMLALQAAAWASPVPVHRAALSNGLVLLHQENPGSLTTAVACFLRISAAMETSDTAGWRNLLQQAVLDLPDASGRRLEERIADEGSQVRLQTSADYTEALFQGTADQLPQLLAHAREILSDEQPSVERLNARRQQILREITNRRELPETLAEDALLGALFRGTSCSWPSTGSFALSAVGPQRLLALRRMHYVPNQAVVAISGPVDWDQAQALARGTFGDLLPHPLLPRPTLAAPRLRTGMERFIPWGGDNAVIVAAAPCPGPNRADFAAAAVLGAVLGQGEGSRLFASLRDERGLAYTVQTDLAPSQLCAMVQITVTCEPKQAGEVFKIMRAEIAGAQSKPPSEAEVQRAIAYLTGSYLLGHQRNGEIAHYLGLFESLLPGQGAEFDLVALFDQVTVAQVEAATRWLQDGLVWVQVGGRPVLE